MPVVIQPNRPAVHAHCIVLCRFGTCFVVEGPALPRPALHAWHVEARHQHRHPVHHGILAPDQTRPVHAPHLSQDLLGWLLLLRLVQSSSSHKDIHQWLTSDICLSIEGAPFAGLHAAHAVVLVACMHHACVAAVQPFSPLRLASQPVLPVPCGQLR